MFKRQTIKELCLITFQRFSFFPLCLYHIIIIFSAKIHTPAISALHFFIMVLLLIRVEVPGLIKDGLLGAAIRTVEATSFWFTLLRLITRIFCVLSGYRGKDDQWSTLLRLFLFNSLIVFLITYTEDYILFFVYFEISMLPVYWIIIHWGTARVLEVVYSVLLIILITRGPYILIIFYIKTDTDPVTILLFDGGRISSTLSRILY